MVFVFLRHFVNERCWKEFVNNRLHSLVQSCREQHLLTGRANASHHAANRLNKAKLAHVVGFVHDQSLNLRKVNDALSDKVFQTTRSSNHDVNTAAHCVLLLTLWNTTVNTCGVETYCFGNTVHSAVDLVGQLTSWSQDQRARLSSLTRHRTTGNKLLNHWHGESNRLTRSGLSTAKHVNTGHCCRNRCCLNWERLLSTHAL